MKACANVTGIQRRSVGSLPISSLGSLESC